MRKPFVAGNWKMNTNGRSSVELVEAIVSKTSAAAKKAGMFLRE